MTKSSKAKVVKKKGFTAKVSKAHSNGGRLGHINRALKSMNKKKAIMTLVGAGVMTGAVATLYVKSLQTNNDPTQKEIQRVFLDGEAVVNVQREIVKNKVVVYDTPTHIHILQETPYKHLKQILNERTLAFTTSENQDIKEYQNKDFQKMNSDYRNYLNNGITSLNSESVKITERINTIILENSKHYDFELMVFRGRGSTDGVMARVGDIVPVTNLMSTTLDSGLGFSFMTRNHPSGRAGEKVNGMRDYGNTHKSLCCFYRITLPPKFPIMLLPPYVFSDEFEVLLPVLLKNKKRYSFVVTQITEYERILWTNEEDAAFMSYVEKHAVRKDAETEYAHSLLRAKYITAFTLIDLAVKH
jgi:hypothetical protein